jgi:mono/diheme cytochrome c family protein
VQYVAVMTGATINAPVDPVGAMPMSRVLVYRLDGKATLPSYPVSASAPPAPMVKAGKRALALGERLFAENCSLCHGPDVRGTGVVPDLRRSSVIQNRDAFRSVLAGALAGQGMPDFSKWISPEDADAIRAYIAAQAEKMEN